MTERLKRVALRVTTIYRLRQLMAAGESLDAVVRRLAGLEPVVLKRPGPAPVQKPMVPRGAAGRPRSPRYEPLRRCALHEIVTVAWELDERGQIVPGQPALTAVLHYLRRTKGLDFMEQSGSGQGTRWLRIA